MKKIVFLVGVVLAGHLLMAQPKPTDLDKSPMDVSYFPANYPILKMRGQVTAEPSARVFIAGRKRKEEIFLVRK